MLTASSAVTSDRFDQLSLAQSRGVMFLSLAYLARTLAIGQISF
jgi:hypothetical protein